MRRNNLPRLITCRLTVNGEEYQNMEARETITKMLNYCQVRETEKDYKTDIVEGIATFTKRGV